MRIANLTTQRANRRTAGKLAHVGLTDDDTTGFPQAPRLLRVLFRLVVAQSVESRRGGKIFRFYIVLQEYRNTM